MSGRLVALWSAPRSRSTAFFRSMLERRDIVALHEPFCDLADHGETEVLGQTLRSLGGLKKVLVELARTETVFLKETTDHPHSALLADSEFAAHMTHTFLVRRPDEIAASYYALKPDMTCAEVGVEHLWRIYVAAAESAPSPPLVIDSSYLVADPDSTMEAYCASIGLPFVSDSLNWAAGGRPEWRQTERWHVTVANTTRFTARTTRYGSTVSNTPLLSEFSAHHWTFYERLLAIAQQQRNPGSARASDASTDGPNAFSSD